MRPPPAAVGRPPGPASVSASASAPCRPLRRVAPPRTPRAPATAPQRHIRGRRASRPVPPPHAIGRRPPPPPPPGRDPPPRPPPPAPRPPSPPPPPPAPR